MSRYSSESSSDYVSGNEPRHRRRIKIYDRDGNVIKDSVREFAGTQTQAEKRKDSVDSSREGKPQVLEVTDKTSTDTKEPSRHSHHQSPSQEEGQRRLSLGSSSEKDENRKLSLLGKEKVKNNEPQQQQQRHSFERRRRSLDKGKGKHEEKRKTSFESDKQNGHQEERLFGSNDRAISRPPDKRRTSKEEEETRKNSLGEKDKDEDGGQCVIPGDNPHHVHHHRVHHHRHYKKFIPHSSAETTDDAEVCKRNEPETAKTDEDEKNRNSQRPPVTDHTTSVSRVFRPKMNDRDVAISISPVSSRSRSSSSVEVMKPRTARTARFGRLVDMNDPDETDEGSFLYNEVPLPDSSERKIAQASNVALEGSDCPFCGQGKFRRKFTWTGVMASILLFPCGIYCCFKYRVQVCTYCGISPL